MTASSTALLLTPSLMAQAAGGYWENLPADAPALTGISLDKNSTRPGDLYFRLNPERVAAGVNTARRNGAVAAALPLDATLNGVDPLHLPVLRVADVEQALKKIAAAARDASPAQRVLVTGSYGKTGFKTQLYHILAAQIPLQAVLNSNNSVKAIWKSLASLCPEHRLSIIEAAVPSPRRAETVSRFVQPHLAVITWIGHEHLRQHGGTQAHIIANKAKIVLGLPLHGTVLIPQQAEVFSALQAEILGLRPDLQLLTFGTTTACQGQLLQATFAVTHWRVKARIAEQVLDYNLPLLEPYAPLASVSALLAAWHLGGELAPAAARFASYRNFQSSGNFYALEKDGKRFFLYDQSTRIGIEAFKSTLQLMAMLTPAGQGRKIAVFSEFYSLDNATDSVLDYGAFQQLFRAAGLALLFTIGDFSEHIQVLPDKSIWQNHRHTMDEKFITAIIDTLQADDMLFVRGAVEDGQPGLDLLVARLLRESRMISALY